MDRLVKIQIGIAALAAVMMLVIRSEMLVAKYGASLNALEALSFALCAAAILNSARELRQRYQSLGSDKQVARRSAEYMRRRRSVRWCSYFAALVIASLAAIRFNLSVFTVVSGAAVALPILFIVADRASGWTTET